ncbi:hypothetical protein [Nocardioides alkalitolerans]|uniref:hypothetical protein n=1 Tax=Nocardioides alkalitolerans TaxID=281714 RepID=UPI00048B8814|nr:hypothetical protein [Nocardioides alkalitolerans]
MALIGRDEARKLVDELKAALVAVDEKWRLVLHTEAWRSLGYDSLRSFWREEMAGVRVGDPNALTSIAYRMFDEGADELEVATHVTGMGGVAIANALAGHRASLPPQNLVAGMRVSRPLTPVPGPDETLVSAHLRVKERARPSILRVYMTNDELREVRAAEKQISSEGLGDLFRQLILAQVRALRDGR